MTDEFKTVREVGIAVRSMKDAISGEIRGVDRHLKLVMAVGGGFFALIFGILAVFYESMDNLKERVHDIAVDVAVIKNEITTMKTGLAGLQQLPSELQGIRNLLQSVDSRLAAAPTPTVSPVL